MIVDDDRATLQSLRQILGEEGQTVDEAPDGQVVLRHFAGKPAVGRKVRSEGT
jgi:DNA-binding response OmpR family regulator